MPRVDAFCLVFPGKTTPNDSDARGLGEGGFRSSHRGRACEVPAVFAAFGCFWGSCGGFGFCVCVFGVFFFGLCVFLRLEKEKRKEVDV